jgi:hypothetical protein
LPLQGRGGPTYDGAKPNAEDWSEYLQYDPDFQEEFDNIVNDPGISEAYKKDCTYNVGIARVEIR